MESEFVTCSFCGGQVPLLQPGDKPLFFGMYRGDKLIQAICAECYRKGVRYDMAAADKAERSGASQKRLI
jgi:hypothetical protein